MARNDGRIEKGQRLATAISARAWNRTQDAADRVLGPRSSFEAETAGVTQAPYTWVYAKNTTGSDLARWGVLAITGLEITPTGDSVPQFEAMPVLTGSTPSATTTAWGIAVEPIAAGRVGRLAVAGVVQAKTADLGKCGGYQLLWRDATWALIQIGGGLRLGTISATWTKGATATVTEQYGDGSSRPGTPTFTATNWFATVTVSSGTKRVACGRTDGRWILIAAEC